jgi:tetratricopeptide (TPR) repeat protein
LRVLADNEASGDIEAQSRLHSSVGDLRLHQGRMDEAINAYTRSLALGVKVRNTGSIVRAQMDLAHIALASGEFSLALSQFDAAYMSAETIRPSSQLAAASRGAAQAWALDDTMTADVRSAKIKHYEVQAQQEDEKFRQARAHTKKALEAFCIAQALRAAA